MRPVFVSEDLNKKMEDNGYVILPEMLNQEEINDFLNFQEKMPLSNNKSFYTSHWSENKDYRKSIDAKIKPILFDKVKSIFKGYRPIYSYFLVKLPGDKGLVSVHQDWNLVDESKYRGITLWIPLVDTNLQNGSFQIIEKSHQFLHQIRGSNTHFPYRSHLNEIHRDLLTNINLDKGSILAFDHRLAHASLPNFTKESRVALGLVLIPEEVDMVHYYFDPKKKSKQLNLYKVDDDFLIEFGLYDIPSKYKLLDTIDFTNPILPIENLYTSYYLHKGI